MIEIASFLIKICKIQPPNLSCLAVFISFYIGCYLSFFQIFLNLISNNIWKKRFSSQLFLFHWIHPNSPPLCLNDQNPLSRKKFFCQCSLTLSKIVVATQQDLTNLLHMIIATKWHSSNNQTTKKWKWRE